MVITTRGYMRTRDLEAVMGALMLIAGVVFVLPGETLANPVFAKMRAWMPAEVTEAMGGVFLCGVSLTRFWGLYRNSHMTKSPLLRLGGCTVGATFWMMMLFSIGTASMNLSALPMLLGLVATFVGAEFYSAVRTGFDVDALDSLGMRERAFNKREQARRAGTPSSL